MGKKVIVMAAMMLLCCCPLRSDGARVLFDISHDSYPMNQGELDEFSTFLAKRGITVERGGIEGLPSYSLVVITTPQTPFSQSEVASLASYVSGGGVLFLGGQADYRNNDHSESMNALLLGLGSALILNDDEAVDDAERCGERWCVVSHMVADHPITRGIESLSFFSSQTVITSGGALRLASGNETTRIEDADGKGDARAVSGEDITLLALEGIGKGYIIVSGTWHLFDNYNFKKRPETLALASNLIDFISATPQKPTRPAFLENFFAHSAPPAIVVGEARTHGSFGAARDEVDMAGAERLSRIFGASDILRDSKAGGHGGGLVLIGGPAVNALTDAVNPYLPIRFGNDGAWYVEKDGKKYYGAHYGIVATLEVSGRRICVVAGIGGTGTAGAVLFVEKGQVGNPSLVVKNEYGEALLIRVAGDTNGNGIEEETWAVEIV